MRDFRELKVWQKSHGFVLDVYRRSSSFPADERFELSSHIRKSATSISSKIAEGCGRSSDKDFARFLGIASGSASETEYQLLLAHDLGYLDREAFEHLHQLVNEIKKMLNSLIQKLTANS